MTRSGSDGFWNSDSGGLLFLNLDGQNINRHMVMWNPGKLPMLRGILLNGHTYTSM